MFDKEIQKIKVDRANMMAIKKEDTNIQKDIPVPVEKVEKEEDKKVENNRQKYRDETKRARNGSPIS